MNATEADHELLASEHLGTAWLLLCTYLVISMQLGFAALEVGSVREGHRMTVLAKNIMDSVVSCLAFSFTATYFSLSLVLDDEGRILYERELSNWAFCATSVTICSGAMAERTQVLVYLTHAAMMAAVIYPVIADAVWGSSKGFFHAQFHERFQPGYNFHDCAGSGVVHLLGGIPALAGTALLGRRIMKSEILSDSQKSDSDREESTPLTKVDQESLQLIASGDWLRRFDDQVRDEIEFKSCNYLQVMGMFILWVGWYGFNAAGSHTEGASGAGLIAWNTSMAASAGGLGACIYQYGFHLNLDTTFLCNGVLSGLVACTASCDVATPLTSAILGLISGLILYPSCSQLMKWMRFDDPVDATSVHAGAGLFGVLAVAFCHLDCPHLNNSGMMTTAQEQFCGEGLSVGPQFLAQLWGSLVIICWTLLLSASFWFCCALSERVMSTELLQIRRAQSVLKSADSEKINEALPDIVQQSPITSGILVQHGWTGSGFVGGHIQDLPKLQEELNTALMGKVQSALEAEASFIMMNMVGLINSCWPLRALCCIRLRIHPSAELSGLGSAGVAGGKIYKSVQMALSQIAELRQDHRLEHSPLKYEVKELQLQLKSQDALIRRMARGQWGSRSGRLRSVPEEFGKRSTESSSSSNSSRGSSKAAGNSKGASSPTGSSKGASSSRSRPAEIELAAPPAEADMRSVAADMPSPLTPPSVPLQLPLFQENARYYASSETASTTSDTSMGCLTPHSAYSSQSTPPPTMYGRTAQTAHHPQEQPPEELAQMLQTLIMTQNQVIAALMPQPMQPAGPAQPMPGMGSQQVGLLSQAAFLAGQELSGHSSRSFPTPRDGSTSWTSGSLTPIERGGS
mmetsp:Transcript_25332/g.45851  ORF Transcript_25332/g.45851 Transcript_25332/m.45851 type:complete len:858 (+) Transcript_25332:116-2689(+)